MSEIDGMSLLVGKLEAGLDSLNDNLKRVADKVDSIDRRLSHIERAEMERKGAWRVLIFVAGLCGAIVTKLAALVTTWIR